MPADTEEVSVALFDMDRTLVRTHTANLYTRFQRDIGELGRFHFLRNSWWLLQYSVGMVDAERVALQVLTEYRGKTSAWLTERCNKWFADYVAPEISREGRARVEQHRAQGHVLAIATSAVSYAAQPLATALDIPHLVCSELALADEQLTGEIVPPLCYGVGKLTRAEAFVRSLGKSLAQAAFYTDSITDLPLLEAVGYPIAINPDVRLRRIALQRSWPIEEWRSV
jgi:HAD superfamily hydrolase (TIGR01490 family)